jgi:hypothetical protein
VKEGERCYKGGRGKEGLVMGYMNGWRERGEVEGGMHGRGEIRKGSLIGDMNGGRE